MISKLKYEFSRNMVHNYTLYSYYNSIGYFDRATYISITFCELSAGKLVTKGTYAKMVRGEMIRFMAENRIENPEEIKKFNRLGYVFREDLFSKIEYVFERRL